MKAEVEGNDQFSAIGIAIFCPGKLMRYIFLQVWQRAAKFLEYDPEQHELEVEMGFIDPSNPPVPGFNL